MSKQIPGYLKLVRETTTDVSLDAEDYAVMADVCRSFERLTGWQLEYSAGSNPSASPNLMWSAPVDPGVGIPPGHIRILTRGESSPAERIPVAKASVLAESIGRLWTELLTTRATLWQREAELAAGIPLVSHGEEAAQLAAQLEAVLRGGAESVGCHAAALYLLDSATSELKLRSSWGLPRRRLLAPARTLRGAVADLEALMGHAVVLTDDQLHDYWKAPERFAAAVCVPVASPSMPLGTLWVFSRHARDFTDEQTQVLELVAGRLAADLERKVLLDEKVESRKIERQLEDCERRLNNQLPQTGPLIDGWDVAGVARQSDSIGGAFYDWFAMPDGHLAITAGVAHDRGINAAISAATLRAALRTQGTADAKLKDLVAQANRALCASSAGESTATLMAARVGHSSRAELVATGSLRTVVARLDGYKSLEPTDDLLGQDSDLSLSPLTKQLSASTALVAFGAVSAEGTPLSLTHAVDDEVATAIGPALSLPAEHLTAIAEHVLETSVAGWSSADRFVLIIKRRDSV